MDDAVPLVADSAQRPCHAHNRDEMRMSSRARASRNIRIAPITQAEAKRFIARNHRHNDPSLCAVFVVGLKCSDELVGVAMCGLPKARRLMDGETLEVTRTCTDGSYNSNSMLYGACSRVAKSLGYKRLVTYTLETESGASLKASGWTMDETLRNHNPDGWKTNGKGIRDLFGNLRMPDEPKVRWWKHL